MSTRNYDKDYTTTYNNLADEYDNKRFGTAGGGYAKQYKNELIHSLLENQDCLSPDKKILDIPSGTGRVAHMLLENSRASIYAADISTDMLRVNKENLQENWNDRISYHETNMKELPFDDNTFDAAAITSFFYLIPLNHYSEYTKDIIRVLKPGGVLIVEVSNAMTIFNPLTLLKLIVHKHLKRKPVKSYAYVWNLPHLFNSLELISVYGTEYPLIYENYNAYKKTCRFLGGHKPFKWLGGKYTLVLRKRQHD